MPKVIQPRRHDKQLSADEFWKIRDLAKTQSNQNQMVLAFRQEEVAQRNRYHRPSEKAKLFNPLQIMLRREMRTEDNALYMVGDDDENTCTGEFLNSVLNIVNSSLKEIKHYVMGRRSIVYNIDKIYEILWNQLQIQEAWPLLQAVIKDLRGERFELWLSIGLRKLAQTATAVAQTNFNELFFRNLFDTISILMQHFYDQIVANLQAFFLEFGQNFFKHSNKYVRKFSVQCFSYIFSNLSVEDYHEFMTFLVAQQKTGFFTQQVGLADLLLQRLKIVRGCLTTASLGHFLDQIAVLANIFVGEEASETYNELVSNLVSLVLASLNNRQGGTDEQILFDFHYILKGLISFSAKEPAKYTKAVLMGMSKFIASYRTDAKRFTPAHTFQITYLAEMWQIFAGFFKENVAHFARNQQMSDALAILALKSSDNMYYSNDVIDYCKANEQCVNSLIEIAYQTEDSVSRELMEIILLLSRNRIHRFFVDDVNTELMYALIILMKRAGMDKLIEAAWLDLDCPTILYKLKRARVDNDLIVALRLSSFIKFDVSEDFCKELAELQLQCLGHYEWYMRGILEDMQASKAQSTDYFNSWKYTKEIILYSHHEIKWLSHIFNLYEAFHLSRAHLAKIQVNIPNDSHSFWNQFIISRPSAVQVIKPDQYLPSFLNDSNLMLNLLASRNREVRYSALQVVFKELDLTNHAYEISVVSKMMQIDENPIDLQNEREVKRLLCMLEQELHNFNAITNEKQAKDMLSYLIQWSLGFAFTGFKLIEKSFISFFSTLIDIPVLVSETQTVVSALLMPFLEYYCYRHSRQYEYDLSPEAEINHLANAYQIQSNAELLPFIQEDFSLTNVDTIEWIGLERISQAVKSSKKGKANLGNRLLSLVTSYFDVQFTRQRRTIQSSNQDSKAAPQAFLKPIKERFLVIMLKLCPSTFLPPFQCLHYTREQFFELTSVRAIKKNNWEAMWQKKKSEGPKKKIQMSEGTSTTVNLEHLAPQEQHMYVHYLWKDILQSNRQKKRIIMDHIRNYLPSASNLLFTLLFADLHLTGFDFSKPSPVIVECVIARLKLMNKKVLLNGMFILKAIILHMKQEVALANNLQTILSFILALIQIVYDYSNLAVAEPIKEIYQKQEDENQSESEQIQYTGKGKSLEYKQQRKELQKLLQCLFANHDLQPQTVTELLQFLLVNTKINLVNATRLSLPGILLMIRIISLKKQYCVILAAVEHGNILSMLSLMIRADYNNERPLKVCYQVWLDIMENIYLSDQASMVDQDHEYQERIDKLSEERACALLSSVLSYLNSAETSHELRNTKMNSLDRKESADGVRLLKIIQRLMAIQIEQVESGWEKYIWQELSKLTKLKKTFTRAHCQRLSLLVLVLTRYIRLNQMKDSIKFLKRVVGVLSNVGDFEQRQKINNLIVANYNELGLSLNVVTLVSKLGRLKKDGLVVQIDFSSYFQACNEYSTQVGELGLMDHEYFLHNLLCYIDNEQLSVRRAVSSSCLSFLKDVGGRIREDLMDILQESQIKEKKRSAVELVLKMYRVLLDLITKQSSQQNQSVFWNIVDNIGSFFNWISVHHVEIAALDQNSKARLYNAIDAKANDEENYFKLLVSLSQANKLKGLRALKDSLQSLQGDDRKGIIEWQVSSGIQIPNPFCKVVLPILEYLIMQPTQFVLRNSNTTLKGNLTSTLSLVSLQILPVVSGLLKESLVKRQLKRLVVRLKFSETETKKNMAIVRMVSQIIEGVAGERVNEKMKAFIEEHGFDEFHRKIAETTRQAVHEHFMVDESEEEAEAPVKKKEKIPGYFQRLEELEDQQAINRHFLSFDRKMMQVEEEGEELDLPLKSEFPRFLKKQILLPLRAMLMMESKTKNDEDKIKGRVLLSVTVTKVLLRLPLDLFLREFQKVIGRLSRLLKKKMTEVRENARSCLCEIAKSVGPQLLYAIILELKFHLKDNFDRHVFNYSLFKIIEGMSLSSGDIDYCLPLVLPSVVDEIFGQSAEEKQIVEKGEVPTLKMQAKKKKGLDLLQLVCHYVSHQKVGYIIDFLQRFLREHLVSEINLGKYDQVLGAISSGFANNRTLMDARNAQSLLPALSKPIAKLRDQIKLLTWEDKARHENTVRKQFTRQKINKNQVLALQQEAGRNGSIFKRMSKQIGERRNQQIIASSLIQFYFVLLSLLVKKQVFTFASTTSTQAQANQLMLVLGFLVECIDHRDNRLVAKSLSILHLAFLWNTADLPPEKQAIGDKFKSLKKQTSRKILLLIEQLTLADEKLLKECFIFLNDLLSATSVNVEMLPNIVAIIKLHTPTTSDQPHLSETYKLTRTILYKCPLHIYNHLLDDLHKMARLQVVTCINREIRELCRHILSVYLKPKKTLQQSIEAFNLNEKKQGNRSNITYEKRLQEQLTFYLSNIESVGQQSVLELLQQFVDNREQDEIQTYGQLLCLGLMTARTNQIQSEEHLPIDKLVIRILARLNQNKIVSLLEKCLLWMRQPRLSSIKLCGTSFLTIILQQNHIKITKNVIDRYVVSAEGVFALGLATLHAQVAEFEANKALGESNKVGKEWDDILNNMEAQTVKYECDPSVFEVLHQLNILLQKPEIKSVIEQYLSQITLCVWKLLHYQHSALTELLMDVVTKITILPILMAYSVDGEKPFLNEKNPFSLKRTIAALLFNQVRAETLERLMVKLIEEQSRLQLNSVILADFSWFMVGLGLKANMKTNIYSTALVTILTLINSITLSSGLSGVNCRQATLAQKPFMHKLLELTVKLASNELITHESKNLNQQTTQILKDHLGTSEYFKAVGEFQTRRRQRKDEERTRVAELAILNPQQYIEEKRGKMRKL